MVTPGRRFIMEAFFLVRMVTSDKQGNQLCYFSASPPDSWHYRKEEWQFHLSTQSVSLHAARKGNEMVGGMAGGIFVRETSPVSQLYCCWLGGSSEQRGFSSSCYNERWVSVLLIPVWMPGGWGLALLSSSWCLQALPQRFSLDFHDAF